LSAALWTAADTVTAELPAATDKVFDKEMSVAILAAISVATSAAAGTATTELPATISTGPEKEMSAARHDVGRLRHRHVGRGRRQHRGGLASAPLIAFWLVQ
jgi:hypothetical protein